MMIALLNGNTPVAAFAGIMFAFFLTCFAIAKGRRYLPKDAGRAFAHDGTLSVGKPRGAGFIFIIVFLLSAFLFAPVGAETAIYLILVGAEMLTGFFDDASEHPWGELKKGVLDLVIAVVTVLTYLNFNSSRIEIATLGVSLTLPPVIFAVLAVILVWASINVTNCADGVDGLSGTLTLITIMSVYILDMIRGTGSDFSYLILLFAVCILGYLWFNATPSTLLMGDAGSRAMGIFISIAILKTGSPLLYLLLAFVLVMDGGLGLIKVSCIRCLKLYILKNTTTPLHDHVRKKLGWSNTQTVFRFAIIQIMIAAAALSLVMIR